jgi:hypothetical protein
VIRTVGIEPADRGVLFVAAGAAVAVGVLAVATSPLIPLAAIVALLLFGLICGRPISGIWLFVLVVATLPFGVIPVPLAGAQLTLVDALLITTFMAVLARLVFAGRGEPLGTPGVTLLVFAVVASAAFVEGATLSAVTPELIRRTGKLLVSLLYFVVAVSLLTTIGRLTVLLRCLMFAGAFQGAIGVALMAQSPLTQLDLLTRLAVIGYPTNNVLRYVPGPNNTYTDQLRAIGTSIDPNVFGGTLMLALALIVVQWASPRPVLPKGVLVVLALPTAAGVLLSLSRASWLGLAAGLCLVGLLCYRRILVMALLGGLAVLVTPFGQGFVTRFVSGFSSADPATAFRIGEYSNALTLIERYPVLGIGFGVSPDIDVSAGVSSVYLLVGEQTGLLGLCVYVVALVAVWRIGVSGLSSMSDARLQGIRAAFFGAFSGALVTGLLDQYFANQDFPHAVALFWLYAAALVSASRLSRVPVGHGEPERNAKARAVGARAQRSPG